MIFSDSCWAQNLKKNYQNRVLGEKKLSSLTSLWSDASWMTLVHDFGNPAGNSCFSHGPSSPKVDLSRKFLLRAPYPSWTKAEELYCYLYEEGPQYLQRLQLWPGNSQKTPPKKWEISSNPSSLSNGKKLKGNSLNLWWSSCMLLAQANGIRNLCALVAAQSGNTHLRHDLPWLPRHPSALFSAQVLSLQTGH